MCRLAAHIALLTIIVASASPAAAQTWTGAVDGNWANNGNWTNGLPGTGSNSTVLTFGTLSGAAVTNVNNNIVASFQLNEMLFLAGQPAYQFGGASLNFVSNTGTTPVTLPSISMNSNNGVTIGNLLSLSNNLTVTGTGNLTLNGTLGGIGSLTMSGAGTLTLGGSSNSYSGGTFVTAGTLLLTQPFAIRTGTSVTVGGTGTLNTGGLTNQTGPLGALNVAGSGQVVATSGSGGYYVNRLTMTGGAIDLTGTTGYALHFPNGSTGITVNANATASTFTGPISSSVINDSSSTPLAINVADGGLLTSSIPFTGSGAFNKTGKGVLLLASPNNSAAFSSTFGAIQFNDPANLGTSTITLNGGFLQYGGSGPGTYTGNISMTSAASGSGIAALANGAPVTISGVISQPAGATGFLNIYGFGGGFYGTGANPTVILTAANTYSMGTLVEDLAILQIPTIADGGVASPLGQSSNAAANLMLGDAGAGSKGRGDLVLTGTAATYSTNRGALISGQYASIGGGAIGVQNATTTLNWAGPLVGPGTLIKTGAGTLALFSSSNTFAGGAVVEGGTLSLGVGSGLPAGANVTVQDGATFSTGGLSNSAATALGTVNLNGTGTFTATGSGAYYLNQLVMTNGKVDLSSATNYTLHFVNSGAGITLGAGVCNWLGNGHSFVVNDTNAPLPITEVPVNNMGALFNVGISLSAGGSNPNFTLTSANFNLTSLGNTANITATLGSSISTNDLSTNIGAGAFGTLGTGTITLNSSSVIYAGASAATDKPLTLSSNGGIQVFYYGGNLTMNSAAVISESTPGSSFYVLGTSLTGAYASMLTVNANNTYTGPTYVRYEATLAVSTIGNAGNGGVASPLGASSNAPGNLVLGDDSLGRGNLLYTGPNASTDRGVTVIGNYSDTNGNSGGAIGVQNAGTNLTWAGQITGTGTLIKTGAGTLTLTNTGNNFNGGIIVEGGTLTIGGPIGVGVMPQGAFVTVQSGATLNIAAPTGASFIDGVTLNGGMLQLSGNANLFPMLQLVMNGGTLNLTIPSGSTTPYQFEFPSSGIIGLGNASWIGPGSYVNAIYGGGIAEFEIQPGVTITSTVDLASNSTSPNSADPNHPIYIRSGGTFNLNLSGSPVTGAYLVVDLSGRLKTSNLAAISDKVLTLNNGTFQYAGSNGIMANDTITGTQALTINSGGGTVEVTNPTTNLTISGAIVGAGGLTKTGSGTLNLTNTTNTYAGGTIVNNGVLAVSGDGALGVGNGPVTVGPFGTLRYTGSDTTTRTFTLNSGTLEAAAGVTLTLNGAAVGGGFLRGTGTFSATAGTLFSGVTSGSGTNITATGSTFVNFTNGGSLSVVSPAGGPVTFNLLTNQGSGSVTVGQDCQLNVIDFQTYGTLTLNPGSFNGTSGNVTQLTNTGGSPMYFDGGSRTFISTVAQVANGNAGFDLHGNDAIVAGGLFVNNGFVYDSVGAGTHRVVADYGSLVKGAGFYQPLPRTINGGTFIAGNSPGHATTGTIVLGGPNDPAGGLSDFTWQINDAGPSASYPSATGVSGPSANVARQVSGWGTLLAVVGVSPVATAGDFRWDATPSDKLTIHLQTLLAPDDANGNSSASGGYGSAGDMTPGLMTDFDPSQSYSWRLFAYAGAYIGPADTATLDASTNVDASEFLNSYAGRFDLVLNHSPQEMDLVYTPTAVPEPGSFALLGGVSLVLSWWRRQSHETRGVHPEGHRRGDKGFPGTGITDDKLPR
jgi:autotransporter-associated beta strand protein